jgi:uncharacterized protein
MKKWIQRIIKITAVLFLLFNIIMASNAWKFTHYYNDPALRKTQPTSTWATIKGMLIGQKAPKRLNDSTPNTPFAQVILNNKDGQKLEAWSLQTIATPDSMGNKNDSNTIIMFHGQGSCKAAILNEANEFRKLGYSVFMVDFRSHGGSDGEQSTIGMKEQEDVRCAYEYVKEKTKKEPILYGISLGAATVTRAIAHYQLKPSKLILEMPFGTLSHAVQGFMRIKGLPQFFAPFLTFWGGTLNGKWAFSHQPIEFAKKINCPTLLQWGANDPRVTKQEQEAILNNLNTTQKKLVVYNESAHESLCAKENKKWVENITAFLKQ